MLSPSNKPNVETLSDMNNDKRFINHKQSYNSMYLGYKRKNVNTKDSLDNISINNFLSYYSQPQNAPRKILSLSEIVYFESNISLINTFFFTFYHNKSKIHKFKEKYKNLFTNNYVDILFTMKEFPDFNIFDYLNLHLENSESKKRENKLMIITRNNIILNLLVIATEIHLHEEEGLIHFPRIEKKKTYPYFIITENSFLFNDLSFLNSTIEQFKNIILEEENIYNIEYDVEILFLSLLGYKNTSKIIKQKYYDYFKTFMEECDFIDDFNLDTFLTNTIEKKYFESLTQSEIIVFRKILNNAARRKFYYGFELILQNVEFCYITSEGRIWKNIGKKMNEEQVYNLWNLYECNLDLIKSKNLIETIYYENKIKLNNLRTERKFYQFYLQTNQFNEIYQKEQKYNLHNKLSEYSETINNINHRIKKIQNDFKLNFVTSLRELLEIFFKSDIKELVLYFLEQYKRHRKFTSFPIEIYELCLNYDEDISIDIMDLSLNLSNVKPKYMQICLIKKYFRLARELLKFYVCRIYLNSPPPNSDDYIGWISKIQYKSKREFIENATFKHSRGGKKILNFLQEPKSSLAAKNNYSDDNLTTDDNDLYNNTYNSIYNSGISKKFLNSSNVIKNTENSIISNYVSNTSLMPISTLSKLKSKQFYSKKYKEEDIFQNNQAMKAFTNIIKRYHSNKIDKNKKKGILSRIKDKFHRPKKLKKNSITKIIPRINLITPLSNNETGTSINLFSLNSLEDYKKIKKRNTLSSSTVIDKRKKKSFALTIDMNNSKEIDKISLITVGSISGTDDGYKSENDYSPIKRSNLKDNHFRKSGFCPHVTTKYSNDSINKSDDNSKSKQNITYKSSENLMENNNIKVTPRRKKTYRNKIRRSSCHEIKVENLEEIDFQINVQSVLIEQLRFGEYVCDALCLLNSIEEKCLNRNNFHKIFSFLLVYTTSEDALTKCKEPLLFIGLAAELLLKLGKLNNKLMYKARAVADEILELGEKIQSSIKDEDSLNFFLREQFDHKGRNALSIYAENKFFNLLADNSIGGIVQKIWYGNGYEYTCFRFLRMSRILITNNTYESFQQVTSVDYHPKCTYFTFQYYCYKYNTSSRFFLKTIFYFIICFYYEYIVYTLPDEYYYNNDRIELKVKLANSFLICFCTDFLFRYIFLLKSERKIQVNTLELVILVTTLICIVLLYYRLPEKLSSEQKDKNYEFIESILVSIILIMSWLRVMQLISITYIYGPFIRILINIFWQVFAFMVIVICILFLFGQCFTIFFQNSNPDFKFIYNSFMTLFGTAFGQVDFEGFTQLKIFGYILLMAFTTISNIMLFNLIVGIINNLFNNAQENADAESRAMIILIHEDIKWDDNYGILIFLPPPINIVAVIFNIIIIFFDNYLDCKYYNEMFCKISYIFIAIIYFIYIIILGILCYPFTLFKSYYHIFYDCMYKSVYDEKGCVEKKRKMRFIINILLLPFKLIFIFGEDLFYFWIICYKENLVENSPLYENEFTKDYILELRRVICDLRFKEKKKIISLYEIYERLNLFQKKKMDLISESENKSSRSVSMSNYNLTRINSMSQDSFIESENGRNKRDIMTSSSINLENKYLKESFKTKFRILLDKLADVEGNLDLERALIILPNRVKYSENYLKSLKYLKIRVLIRGIRKLLFKNENNFDYSFKKMQMLIYKIMIKFYLIYNYLNENELIKIKDELYLINNNPLFQKNSNLMMKFEKRDDESEYDDEGDEFLMSNLIQKHFTSTFTKYMKNFQKNT